MFSYLFNLKTPKKKLLKVSKKFPIFNVGTGKNIPIKNLALIIKRLTENKKNYL